MQKLNDRFYGKTGLLLLLVAVLNFGYPLTLMMGNAGDLVFTLAYALMLIIGVLVTSQNRAHFLRTSFAAGIWFVLSLLSLVSPGLTIGVLTQLAIIPAQFLMTVALMRFIARARVVDRSVLTTAVTVYIFLAALFTPLYVVINALDPQAFLDNGLAAQPGWQQLVYFSFVTLATLGYGDIIPINLWARSLATVEGMMGVLFITLIMGRLVGIYSQEKQVYD
ncbi:MAG: potassium channel family protein [Caldilineales bacterium]